MDLIVPEVESVDTVLVINPDTRIINVGSGLLLGVETDNNAERVKFQCPKIVGDNLDLSQYHIYIHYQNAKGETGKYLCEDVEDAGENITFSWLLSQKVTLFKGVTRFLVCAKKTDAETIVWNTTLASGNVLEGLDVDEDIVQQNDDVIEQILLKIEQIEASGGTGDVNNAQVTFAEAQERTNIESQETMSTLFGKIKKWFTDLKTVAFSGSYNDLSNKPSIPKKTSELTNDSNFLTAIPDEYVTDTELEGKGYAIKTDIPKKLPNPNKLTFTGAVSDEYDGSEEKTINIPKGGSDYTLPQATEELLGGIKAKAKTTETIEVAIDTETGKLYVPSYPEDSGSSGGGSSSENLVDLSDYSNSGYSGVLFNDFGANVNVFSSEIDTTSNKILYYRVYRNNQVYDHKVGVIISCYDVNGDFLFKMEDDTGDYVSNFEGVSRQAGNMSEPLETIGDNKVVIKYIVLVNIPENVAKVKFGIRGNATMIQEFYPAFAVSYSQITKYGSITDSDYALTEGGSSSELNNSKPLLNKTLLMIGDSLTNWGGGGDTSNGFLKIIHDRTGIITINQGLAGATWEQAEGQTQPGVTRVDTYVSGSVRYDCIAFLLGTNVSSVGTVSDTSDTKTTMCGAIKYCLEQLISLDSTTPIIVFLPPQRAEGNEEQKTRNDLIKQLCETYGVYTFDLYARSQVIPNTTVSDNGTLSDGLHLSEKGQQNFGRIMTSAILNVMGY